MISKNKSHTKKKILDHKTVLGSASPQAVRKLLALSEQTKTRPHQPRQPQSTLILNSQGSPAVRRAPSATGSYSSYGSHSSSSSGVGGRAMHERSHSDTPTPLPSVALSAESSSVTSLSNLPLRKTLTSGKNILNSPALSLHNLSIWCTFFMHFSVFCCKLINGIYWNITH